jgi:hypothetical protein
MDSHCRLSIMSIMKIDMRSENDGFQLKFNAFLCIRMEMNKCVFIVHWRTKKTNREMRTREREKLHFFVIKIYVILTMGSPNILCWMPFVNFIINFVFFLCHDDELMKIFWNMWSDANIRGMDPFRLNDYDDNLVGRWGISGDVIACSEALLTVTRPKPERKNFQLSGMFMPKVVSWKYKLKLLINSSIPIWVPKVALLYLHIFKGCVPAWPKTSRHLEL